MVEVGSRFSRYWDDRGALIGTGKDRNRSEGLPNWLVFEEPLGTWGETGL